ncbi:MAG: sensor histidine kinase [Jiangellaceae bacterium]
MTLRLRLTLFYSAIFVIVLSAVAVSVYLLTERSLNASLEERAQQALTDLSSGAVLEGLRKLPGDAYYEMVILGREGDVPSDPEVVRNGVPYVEPSRFRPNPTDDDLVSLLSDAALTEMLNSGEMAASVQLPSGESLRVLADVGRLRFPAEQVALSAAVFVGVPASNVTATLDQLAQDLGLTVVLAFVGFAVGVFLLSRQVLRPLERVTQAAGRVTGRDLSQRVPVPSSNDEMRELAVTLNHMLDRLQESFETQRRFTADASHELRTPVTAIVGHANYLLRRTRPSPEQVDSLTVIRREADRMGKLVGDLLELARADAGFRISKQPMNLVEVLEAVHMEVAPVAGEANVVVDAPGPVVEVEGDAARLKQVVLNLVQNALNAGAQNVRMSLEQEAGEALLEVLDDGPGIPDDAIPHLFERFYRVGGARSTRGNGSGLGLAIVRWIVQQHGGDVEVRSRSGEGTVFTVHLPQGENATDTRGDAHRRTGPRGRPRSGAASAHTGAGDDGTPPRLTASEERS